MRPYSFLLVLIGPDACVWIGMGPKGSVQVLFRLYGF